VSCAYLRGRKGLGTCFLNAPLQKLLAINWFRGANLAKAQKSNQAHQKAAGITFAMEIIIMMCWSIWTERDA
jgi:hypothetical protein